MISGEDYTATFYDNKNAGTATVRVTLKGNYYGTGEAQFEISKADLEELKNAPTMTKDSALAVYQYFHSNDD